MTQHQDAIRRVLEGDIESFRFLIERYEKPVIRMIRNIIYDGELCKDIAQDVFFTAYRKLASFDPARSKFSTWLFTIARNKSINALRKKNTISMSKLPEKVNSHNPSDSLSQKEFFDELDKELQALAPKQRTAFVLAEFEMLPYEENAQIEGVRIGTIRSRIHRAKKKLSLALKGFDGDIL